MCLTVSRMCWSLVLAFSSSNVARALGGLIDYDVAVQVAADGGGGGYSKHMRNLDWEFAVIESPDINAFVVPGGKVVVYTGELTV